ncbi:MAG: tRNA (guanine(46)-N(7))-methyltransferase TrmB [Micavibrio sp.]|nr:tRNA (guanine(46)-N(7))-methyltransferase TrmB [Micavibrio sp.]
MTGDNPEGADTPRQPMFYGRRKGKPIRPGKLTAYDAVMPLVQVTLPEGTAPVNPRSFFNGAYDTVWMEIGFGDGEVLSHMAANNPNVGIIGCEPFINGVSALCRDIRDKNLNNVRIWQDDARLLLPRLEAHSLDRCLLLNSDPWPKTRHHKRRFVQQETLDELHRLLKTGAEFRMSTDHADLAAWELEKTYHHGGYSWNATCAADWRTRPADMPQSRYQRKGQTQGRETVFLSFTVL